MQHKLNKKNKGFLVALLVALSFIGAIDAYVLGKLATSNSANAKGEVDKKDVVAKEAEVIAVESEACKQEAGDQYLFVGCNGFF